jgi:hypothetical protein
MQDRANAAGIRSSCESCYRQAVTVPAIAGACPVAANIVTEIDLVRTLYDRLKHNLPQPIAE